MILYHGSYTSIEKPDLSYSRLRTDFGKGFYTTPLKTQAESWARRFVKERGEAAISSYEYLSDSIGELSREIRVLEFDTHNLEWLNFIMDCRMGSLVDTDWDLVIGGVANDKVFDTLQLYFDKLIGAEEAIGKLKYSRPSIQYCFKNQSLIDECLRFQTSEVMK